jgi:hypothetical protein
MRQHPDPDPDVDEEDLEELGTPVYEGSGLSVRALTAEELQRFLDAHHGQPAQPGWTRTLAWRAPLVAAAGVAGQVLAVQAGLPWAGLCGLAVAALVGWRLRFRPSEQARTWQRGAHGERRTARLLDRLTRDSYVVFHDLAVPGKTSVNVDHLAIGPTGVFVIDSKQWTGNVHQSADGLTWHNHYRLDRTLETVRWEADTISRILGTHTAALLCIHGAHIQGGGLHAQGVAIVPAGLLRDALGDDRVLSHADLELLATAAWSSLRPAA